MRNQQDSGADGGRPAVSHSWLVRSGNRVALLSVSKFGEDYPGTNDAKVLADLLQALEK